MNNNQNLNQQSAVSAGPVNSVVPVNDSQIVNTNAVSATNVTQPVVNTVQPGQPASQQAANVVQPVVGATQQVANTAQPGVAAPQQVANTAQPGVAVPQQVANTAQTGVVATQQVANVVQPVTNSIQPSSQTLLQQQRVQLINNKPGIQAIVPNNIAAVKSTNSAGSHEENVEMLEEDISVDNGSGGSSSNGKGSKLKTFFLILLFGGLFAVIIFLPNISSYIQTQKYLKTQKEEIITTGTLKCEFENSSDELDYNYSLDFIFKDNKLTRLTYVTEIRGDINLDAEKLDVLKVECDKLSLNAKQLNGVTVSCELNGSTLTKKQVLNYASINVDETISAYMEAGGIYPDYENGQSIDDIEKEMNASGYSCKRIR